jgi:hypothetical protein
MLDDPVAEGRNAAAGDSSGTFNQVAGETVHVSVSAAECHVSPQSFPRRQCL